MLHDQSGSKATTGRSSSERAVLPRAPDIAEILSTIECPDVDEFDLDLRVGELRGSAGAHAGVGAQAAQTDAAGCVPTGGEGTCDTGDPTCPNTCDNPTCPNTCPNTCRPTCPNTCPNTCRPTCRNTCDGFTCDGEVTCAGTCNNTHCFTCRPGCERP